MTDREYGPDGIELMNESTEIVDCRHRRIGIDSDGMTLM
jgi:hypothetical protein